jgi:hypothetical protein
MEAMAQRVVSKIPQPGDNSDIVKFLQDALNEAGANPPLKVDGDFGPKTRAAVSKFQLSKGLAGSGVPGPNTMAALGIKVAVKEETKPGSFSLSWDLKVAGAETWTAYLFKRLEEIYDSHILKITDLYRFRNDVDKFTKDQKIYLVAEIICQMSKYESSWNPATNSVDVGEQENIDTYSVGLMQVSVVDQDWAKPKDKTRYTFKELQKPIPNLDLTISILKRQIEKTGLLILNNDSKYRYWAILLEGNRYSKVETILSTIRKLNIPGGPIPETHTPDQVLTRDKIATTIISIVEHDIKAQLRETNGKNRSPKIDNFNRRSGTYLGAPYCASGLWCAVDDACKALGIMNPVPPTAWSQSYAKTYFVPGKYIRKDGDFGKKGDFGVLQVVGDPGSGHLVCLASDQASQPNFFTVEYNTNPAGSRDGDGAYYMVRSTVDRSTANSGKIFVCFTDVSQWILDFNS